MFAYKKDLKINTLTRQQICLDEYNSIGMDVAICKGRSLNSKSTTYLREFIVIKLL